MRRLACRGGESCGWWWLCGGFRCRRRRSPLGVEKSIDAFASAFSLRARRPRGARAQPTPYAVECTQPAPRARGPAASIVAPPLNTLLTHFPPSHNLSLPSTLPSFARGLQRKSLTLIKKLRSAKAAAGEGEKPEPVRTHTRNAIIVPEMIGSVVGIYNGKTFNQVEIRPDMVGHYLGEFSITYKPIRHGKAGIGATNSSRFIPLK
jgi:ribosomal protein uS19